MVKGRTKRKSEMKKITNKNSLATTFTKRRQGLYSKAAQHCLLTGSQIAILATPSSSHSNVSFYSFGHSSVDAIVSAFLSGKSLAPVQEDSKEMREDIGVCLARKELGLGFWWEDERLARSKDPEEIDDAIKSLNSLLSDADKLLDFSQREAVVVSDEMKGKRDTAKQTLIIQDDQNLLSSDNFLPCGGDLYEWGSIDVDELLGDLPEEENHQVVATCENFCNINASLPVGGDCLNHELDFDFQTILEGFSHQDLDEFAATFTI